MGYDKKDCVLPVNEEEAQVVCRIFDLYANAQMGIRRISQTLYDEGFTSRKGNAFNVLTIESQVQGLVLRQQEPSGGLPHQAQGISR